MRRTSNRTATFIRIVISVVFCLGASSCVTQRIVYEIPKVDAPQDYMGVFLNGSKIGYTSECRIAEPDKVITITNTFMESDRFGSTVRMAEYKKHIESPDGEPIAFEYIGNTSSKFLFFQEKKSKKVDGVIKGDGGFEITKTINGKTKSFEIDRPKELLLSEGLRLLIKKTGLKEGAKFSVKEIFEYDPIDICDEEGTVGKTKKVFLMNRADILTEIFLTAKTPRYGKISVTVYADKEFHVRKAVMNIGWFKLEMISCSREFAMSKSEKIDLTNMAFIQCPVRLDNPGKAERIKYYLVPVNNIELDIPVCDNQSVDKGADGSLLVTVHPAKAAAGVPLPYNGSDKTALEALKPTDILECDDEKIIALARKAVGNTKDAAKAAAKIEAFVNGYVQLSSSSVFASAVEVADERKGDCTEFAVLTAALCRAAGIPARVMVGYAYFDYYNWKWNVFVPHAWTEAYIGDKWVGLDATKNRFFGMSNSFTAGYIALSGTGDEALLSGIGGLGAFKIKRVEQ